MKHSDFLPRAGRSGRRGLARKYTRVNKYVDVYDTTCESACVYSSDDHVFCRKQKDGRDSPGGVTLWLTPGSFVLL